MIGSHIKLANLLLEQEILATIEDFVTYYTKHVKLGNTDLAGKYEHAIQETYSVLEELKK